MDRGAVGAGAILLLEAVDTVLLRVAAVAGTGLRPGLLPAAVVVGVLLPAVPLLAVRLPAVAGVHPLRVASAVRLRAAAGADLLRRRSSPALRTAFTL